MAYMSQENKKALAPAIKAILKKHGLKGSLGVRNHSTLVLKITSGTIDFAAAYQGERSTSNEGFAARVNHYYITTGWTGQACEALTELAQAMMVGNHDRSDSMTDYFDVGWYVDLSIGEWNKPYVLN